MAERTIVGGVDTYVTQVDPSASRNGPNYALVKNGTGDNARMLLFIKAPTPVQAGVQVTSARLVLHQRFASRQNVTYEAIPVRSSWKAGKATWNNQPDIRTDGLIGTVASGSVTSSDRDELIEFDVTPHMQGVANGVSWYGWRIRVDTSDTTTTVFTSEAGAEWRRPRLIVEYSNAPAEPTDLSPGGGRFISIAAPVLQYTFADFGGNQEQMGQHIQVDWYDEFGVPDTNTRWNTGEIPASVPELDLSTAVDENSVPFPGVAN